MRRKTTWLPPALLLALCASAAPAYAQSSRLADAQQAYAAVDYENTRELSKAALEQGGNDRTTTGELYLLWATAAAALDQIEEARDAFLHALVVNPDLKLDRSLSPKIRAPYQEARGSLTAADGKLPLSLTLQRSARQLEITVHDSQGFTSSVELSTRSSDSLPFTRQRLHAAPTLRVMLPGEGEMQAFCRVLDAHGNVLFEQGSESEPQRLPGASPRALPRNTASSPDVNRTPYYVTAGTLAALGLAAGGVSTAMFLRREDAAKEWNGPSCEKPGATREQQCGALDERRRHAEHLSFGFAAAGSALLIGSVVTLLLTPSSTHPDVALDTTPTSVMFRLRTSL